MKRHWIIAAASLMLFLLTPTAARAERTGENEVLCPPGVYTHTHLDCQPLGPSQYLTRMSQLGITFPMQSMAAYSPDPNLVQVDYKYARVTTEDAPIFDSLETAARYKKPSRRLESGFDFISYIDSAEVKNLKFYKLRSGEWMYAGDLSRTAPPRFQGIELGTTPSRPFGWILHPTETKQTPGYQVEDYTGNFYNRYDMVQIYAEEHVSDWDWFLVGPDEWIEQRRVGRVVPNTDPPEGVDNGRWIEINLYEQTVSVYESNRLVFATLTSTGLPGWWTRPGLFQIYAKLKSDTMRGAFEPDRSDFYYLEDVPWTMYFDQARAIHGAYWHNGFGYPRSHGCVNIAPGDAQWIFDWAQDGDWIYVWDPSGKTPVDEVVYTAGGA